MSHTAMAKQKPAIDFSEATITVLVGNAPDQKLFQIHPSILASRSEFFASALSARWREENSTKPIELTDVDPEIFKLYVTWVYTGDVALIPIKGQEQEQDGGVGECRMAALYALADLLLDKPLRNRIIDQEVEYMRATNSRPGIPTITAAFSENARSDSTLQRLLLDTYLAHTDPEWLEAAWDLLPTVFVRDLTCGWAQASTDKKMVYDPPSKTSKCKYHEHDEEVPMDTACQVENMRFPAWLAGRVASDAGNERVTIAGTLNGHFLRDDFMRF